MAKDFQGEMVLCRDLYHQGANFPSIPFFLNNTFQDSLRSSLQSCHFVAVDGFADSQVSEMICMRCNYIFLFVLHSRCVIQIYVQIYLSKENARMVKTEEQEVLKSN